MIIDHATPAMVYHVSKNMRDRDFEEIGAVRFEDSREELAQSLAASYGSIPMTLCLGAGHDPIAILSAVGIHPNVWSMGFWATPQVNKISKELTRFCCNEFFDALLATGMHRVECKSIMGYDTTHRWLLSMGFKQESILRSYGKGQEDFILFSWCRGMPLPKFRTAV